MLSNMIRVETAIIRFPLHRLAKISTDEEISIEETYLEDDTEKRTIWKVRHRPGPLAYKVETLVINRRIDEIGRPVPKVMPLGSLREIGRLASLGNNTEKVKEALRQNAFAAITAKFRYTTKNNRKKHVEVNFTRYKMIFAGEELPDGTTADQVFIIFDDDYLKIINTAQNRPLDYDFLKILPPMAQRFYELFSFHMYAALHNRQPTAKMLYSDFCKYAPQSRQMNYEAMTKQMYKVHRHHLDHGYISKVSYLSTRSNPMDWWMIYQPGERARREYNFSQGNYALPNGNHLPSPALSAAIFDSAVTDSMDSAGNLSEAEVSLLKELSAFGVRDKLALELVALHPARVREQIDALPFRPIKKSVSGYLIKAIRENYSLPMPLLPNFAKDGIMSSTINEETSQNAGDDLTAEGQITAQLESLYYKFESFQSAVTDRGLQFAAKTITQSLTLLIAEAKESTYNAYEEIEERLNKLEQLLDDSLLRLANEDIQLEVKTTLKGYGNRMSVDKLNESIQIATLTSLRRKYLVPRLSLFLDF